MQPVTVDMVRDHFARESDPGVLLITIEAENMDTIRITDAVEGLTSRGDFFTQRDFDFGFPGASAEEPARTCQLLVDDSDGALRLAIRQATPETPPTCTVELVRAEAPDVVEVAVRGAKVRNTSLEDLVTLELQARDFAGEFACKARYTMSRTPGLY